ncbi:membrane-spanning 4-domains subfamily A member 7-like [Rhynchocyon petersi]
MLSQPKIKELLSLLVPKDKIILQSEKLGYTSQKEYNLKNGLQKEATVLGTIQILCCLTISSLEAVLVFAPHSFHFNSETSDILVSGYSCVGSLCFAITGSLSIISGKKSTKCFAMSSLISHAVSSVVSGAGLILLTYSLVVLETASQPCDPEEVYLASLPYANYYSMIYETKDCLLAGASLMGVLVVMLTFTVLEFLLAVYASLFWRNQVLPNNPVTMQILFGLMNFSFGMILLFTCVDPYPRFPLIFISGYPFWSPVLGIFIMLIVFTITEFFIALSFSLFGGKFACVDDGK